MALLEDLMNPRLLSISFVSFVPPIALSLLMYVVCKYAEKKAEAIVTEREEQEEQRRRDIVAALTRGERPASTKTPPDK
jgi:cytochrome c-type biogenesis protein CcmH/NrfF